jgi:formate dehydrogenase iron-sulfur subunit
MQKYGILIDTTMCIACYECERADAERWGRSEPTPAHELSSEKNTAVYTINDSNLPRQCMHCQDPSCASVCPVGAFTKTAEGPVTYDADKCMGCRYCMQACPFDVPKYQWGSVNPKVTKCDMCRERILKGDKPACVAACPTGARTFGPLNEIIDEAKKRVRENPQTYYSEIYGLKEAGGTSIIYLSAKPFQELGLRTNLPNEPMPNLTWAVMSKIPNYVGWMGTLLGGVWWITNRRNEVQKYERKLKDMEKRNPSRSKNAKNNHDEEGADHA